jgi:hypothetical protein
MKDQRRSIMPVKRIVAVGVAEDRGNQEAIIGSGKRSKGIKKMKVRPYIQGVIQGLDAFGQRLGLGKDYVIHFRQREVANLNAATFARPAGTGTDPYVIFCMSTNVVRAAANLFPPASNQPIVGIVSEPDIERAGTPAAPGAIFNTLTNICGISARRVQSAGRCYERFVRAVPTLRTVHVLHMPNYGPSERALVQVGNAVAYPQQLDVVNLRDAAHLIQDLNGLPEQDPDSATNHGVLVLPIDVCLGHAQEIIDFVQQEKGMPAFFPVPDWVRSDTSGAFGAYGLSQRQSGMLMAERVQAIWANNGTVPGGAFARWKTAPEEAFDFLVSAAVAEDQNIQLDSSIPRV